MLPTCLDTRGPLLKRPRSYFTPARVTRNVTQKSIASLLALGHLQSKHTRTSVRRDAAVDTGVALEFEDVVIERFPAPAPGAFLPDKRSFQEEHRIRGYEVSPDQRATIVTIANLLQEVAGNHAVGMWGRTDEGFASLPTSPEMLFVMTRLQVRMYEYPKWGDLVSVETYFTEEGRLAFRRDWRITSVATGKLLGAVTSTWVTINMATRRIAKVPDLLRKKFLRFGPPSTMHVLPPEETKRKLPDMQLPGQVQGPQQVARRNDMDMNGHINNVTYLAWALESVPDRVFSAYQLYEIELDFKAECQAGDMVESHCSALQCDDNGAGAGQPGDGSFEGVSSSGRPEVKLLHLLQKCADGSCTELVRVRSTWRPHLAAAPKA